MSKTTANNIKILENEEDIDVLVNFDTTIEEDEIIASIVARGVALAVDKKNDFKLVGDIYTVIMDVQATHCNGMKLNLKALLEAGEEEFIEDLKGIQKHICRMTGKLTETFVPKFALLKYCGHKTPKSCEKSFQGIKCLSTSTCDYKREHKQEGL